MITATSPKVQTKLCAICYFAEMGTAEIKLRMCDTHITRIPQNNWVLIRETAKESSISLIDESYFRIVREKHGRKRMVFFEELVGTAGMR